LNTLEIFSKDYLTSFIKLSSLGEKKKGKKERKKERFQHFWKNDIISVEVAKGTYDGIIALVLLTTQDRERSVLGNNKSPEVTNQFFLAPQFVLCYLDKKSDM